MNCTTDPRDLQYLPLEWASFLSPVALLLTYYLIAFESSALLKPQVCKKKIQNNLRILKLQVDFCHMC